MKVTVVGGGRMNLPLACVFGKRGATVTVADRNSALVDKIQSGACPYEEPGLGSLIASSHAAGRLAAATNTTAAAAGADVIVVMVPAHLTPDRDIDFSIRQSASADVGRGLRPGALVAPKVDSRRGGSERIAGRP